MFLLVSISAHTGYGTDDYPSLEKAMDRAYWLQHHDKYPTQFKALVIRTTDGATMFKLGYGEDT